MNARLKRHLARDIFILAFGIIFAGLLVRLGFIDWFLSIALLAPEAASFIAGMFFTSVITIAPASVALIAIAQGYPPIEVALWGGVGATLVDLILFSFIRNDLSKDFQKMLKPKLRHKVISFFHFGFAKWIVAGTGALIIASPFPDEIGLVLLSIARIKPQQLMLLTFVMNTIGILILTSAGTAILQ